MYMCLYGHFNVATRYLIVNDLNNHARRWEVLVYESAIYCYSESLFEIDQLAWPSSSEDLRHRVRANHRLCARD
jgi:hypothetical protein